MKKLLSLLFVCGMLLAGCSSNEPKDDKTLKVLTSSGYEPYEIVDKDTKELTGFDIDVMNEAAKIAGYEIEWIDMDFDGIIDSIKTGKGDVAIAGITPTPKRMKQVDFSDVYYAGDDSQNYILCLKDSDIKSTADLKGKKIGTQMGTIQEVIVNDMQKKYNLTIDARKNYTDMVLELEKGNIDAMVVEQAVAVKQMKKHDKLASYKLEEGGKLAGNAMAFKKGSELKKDFDKAIEEMKKSGKMEELVNKYFNVEK